MAEGRRRCKGPDIFHLRRHITVRWRSTSDMANLARGDEDHRRERFRLELTASLVVALNLIRSLPFH
jgi:hypothetical protein